MTVRDYYGMAGIFGSTSMITPGNVSGWTMRSISPEGVREAFESHGKAVAELTEERRKLDKRIGKLTGLIEAGGGQSLANLEGVAQDSSDATLSGKWKTSNAVKPFVGADYAYTDETGARAEWRLSLPRDGEYEVRVSYTAHGNRAKHAGLTVFYAGGSKIVEVDQTRRPPLAGGFVSLGVFRFEKSAGVRLEHVQPGGNLVADAVQLLPVDAVRTEVRKPKPPSERQLEVAELNGQISGLDQQLSALKKKAPPAPTLVMAIQEAEKVGDEPLHIRGQVRNLGDPVPRGFIEVTLPSGADPTARIAEGQSGRLELANWIASERNPLTARVYVNRVWRHLMGEGLVATPDNFGTTGAAPTHPELLDYLATRFMESGWSTTTLIRQIMNARVYRLGLDASRAMTEADPDNRLLGRAHRRRLEAEPLRDAMLAVSGELDTAAGGLTIGKVSQYDRGYEHGSTRRSVYVPAFRAAALELFEVFDAATPNVVTGKRPTSTLPTQALYMMNNGFVIERAAAAAARLLEETAGPGDHEGRVRVAYLRTVGREPTAVEARQAMRFIASTTLDDGGSYGSTQDAYAALFHALFASTDFRYLN
jgi:hypothetical protein